MPFASSRNPNSNALKARLSLASTIDMPLTSSRTSNASKSRLSLPSTIDSTTKTIDMPLTSSRTSNASKSRLSLPSTIDSTTKATRTKAVKRRNSLRTRRDPSPEPRGKENASQNDRTQAKAAPASPGPTPYHIVSFFRAEL